MKRTILPPGVCPNPFVYAEFLPGGSVSCCCPDWTKVGSIGNIGERFWNSDKARHIRDCIYDGRYSEICRDDCHQLIRIRKGEPPIHTQFITDAIAAQIMERKCALATKPVEIALSADPICNLYCVMCRPSRLIHPSDRQPKGSIEAFRWIKENLRDIRLLTLSGFGEPFFSPTTRRLLNELKPEEAPNLSISFITNGQLLNQRMWDIIKRFPISQISVSVNAAKRETYEKVQRGAKWDLLQANMGILSRLRERGELSRLQVSMVVMKSNVDEMAEFVEMAEDWKADSVVFLRVTGTLAGDENFFDNPDAESFSRLRSSLIDDRLQRPFVNSLSLTKYARN